MYDSMPLDGGKFMVSSDDIQKSISEYDKGLEYAEQGFVSKAAAYFLATIRLNPGFMHAYYLLAQYRIFHVDDPLIRQYQFLTHMADVSAEDRAMLHFCLAKIYQDLALPQQVLTQVTLAHAYLPQVSIWERYLANVNRVIRAFPPAFFAKRMGYGVQGVAPIFLMGLPQSGVARVDAVLRQCHGTVSVQGGRGVRALIDTLNLATQGECEYPENMQALDIASTQQLGNAYLSYLEQIGTADTALVIDSCEDYIEHLGLISVLFPQAKIILCHRDPVEVCLAQYCQQSLLQPTPAVQLSDLGMRYHAYLKLVQHWMMCLPVTLQVMQVQYDDWMTEPDAIPQLLAFCGLDTVQVGRLPESVSAFDAPGWAAAYIDCVPELTRVLGTQDTQALAYQQAALCQYEMGHYAESQRLLRRAIKSDKTFTQSYLTLFQQKRFVREDDDIGMVQRCLAEKSLRPEQRADCQFALAKAYDDLHFDEQAFALCEQANAAVRVPFHEAAWACLVDEVMAAFHETQMQKCRDGGHNTAQPIFVFGMPGSGLTWVEHRISCHPDVQSVGAQWVLDRLVTALPHIVPTEQAYPQCVPQLSSVLLEQLALTYIETLEAHVSGPVLRLLDNTSTHFLHLGLLAMMFPQAKFIHCRRHPVDTCLSCYFQPYSVDGPDVYGFGLAQLGRYYHHYQRLMTHWQTVLPNAIYAIEYERWVHRPIEESRQLLAFCGLQWHAGCEQSHLNQRNIQGNHAWQVRQPVYQQKPRRTRYQQHLSELRQGLS